MKIGLFTFHAAHNYGSVLQAYATQNFMKKCGFECEIINYRTPNQKNFYNNLYSFSFDFKKGIQKLMRLPEHRERKERLKKFEKFISDNLKTTEREYSCYEELTDIMKKYDVLISGSDQVWNENCVAEFYAEPKNSIYPFYLKFDNINAKKISFSSSFGTMTKKQIKKYLPDLQKYDFLSVREQDSAELLSKMLKREVISLIDPTLLLNKNEWAKLSKQSDYRYKNYILIYSLGGLKDVKILAETVKKIAEKKKMKVIVIAPLTKVICKGVNVINNCGAEDFLYLVKNARYIVTNSFHGTAFSINFEKPFVAFHDVERSRVAQLLEKMGLSQRRTGNLNEIENLINTEFDFSYAGEQLKKERKKAQLFIKNSLSGGN